MGKAGKRKEMVEDRSSEVLCEKVVCEKVYPMYLKKVGVSSVEMVEGRLYERGRYESFVCERVAIEKVTRTASCV